MKKTNKYAVPDLKKWEKAYRLREGLEDGIKWTFTDIGEKLGITPQRAAQLWEKYHKHLKGKKHD